MVTPAGKKVAMGEWSVESTDDIQEVDKKRKPAGGNPFDDEEKAPPDAPGKEKGSQNEWEQEPDKDKEAPP